MSDLEIMEAADTNIQNNVISSIENNIDELICSECMREFSNQSKLNRHKNAKRRCKIKSDDFCCNRCAKKFSRKYNLERHSKICKAPLPVIVNNETNTLNCVNEITKNLLMILSTIPNNHNNDNIKSLVSKLLPNSGENNTTSNISIVENINNGTINNNINNTVINNNVINIINPFGYEDISHISDEDKLKILTSRNGFELVLKLVYENESNCNFYRPNANKDNISILDNNFKVQCKDKKQFNEAMIDKSINLTYRVFDSCRNRLSFESQHYIEENINHYKKIIRFNNYFQNIINIIETCLQDKRLKDNFKSFIDRIQKNNTFRLETIKEANKLVEELERFYNNLNNVSITDEYLRAEIWSKEESNDDADLDNRLNDLSIYYIENTPRYKFFNEMKNEEMEYFEEHGCSLGNLIKYRLILLERAKEELKILNEIYKNEILYEEIKNKLMPDNYGNANKLSKIKFEDSIVVGGYYANA